MTSNSVLHSGLHNLLLSCCGARPTDAAEDADVDEYDGLRRQPGKSAPTMLMDVGKGAFVAANCVYEPQSVCSYSPVRQRPLARLSASLPGAHMHSVVSNADSNVSSPRRYRKRMESPLFNPYLRPRAASLEEINGWCRHKERIIAAASANASLPQPNLCTLPNLSDESGLSD